MVGLVVAACGSPGDAVPDASPDAAPRVAVTITATIDSTRFVTREHMLASAEMQISGEPLAETMGRTLASYSRDLIPTDLYFDPGFVLSWVDLPGFSTGIESYEYSKQPMNGLAFESGAGTALAYAPLVDPDGATGPAATAHLTALVQHYAAGSHGLGRFVFPAGATNPLGWPGLWPTAHVYASFDPAIDPTSDVALACAITSDDDPDGALGATVICGDYECDATTLHLRDRTAQLEHTITPGADGFSGWKYGLWVMNYLEIMHDAAEAPVARVAAGELAQVGAAGNTVAGSGDDGIATAAGTYLGSSDIEGFQAQLLIAMIDNRAADWLGRLTTSDGVTLSGFASIADALGYGYTSPLRWFPRAITVTEQDLGGGFPRPTFALGAADSELLDLDGLLLGFAEAYALTDHTNAHVGGSQAARAMFDGDPFADDDQLADGEATLHDRALAMLRVALVDLDRLHVDPVSGLAVDSVTMSGATAARGHTLSTVSLAYTLIALRTTSRSLGGQLELYSNNTPDTAAAGSPLDALPLHHPAGAEITVSRRLAELIRVHARLLYDHLTDETGRAWRGWDVATGAPISDAGELDAHAAAIRGLFTAYLATGDVRYRDRAIRVFERMDAVFYDRDARLYQPTSVRAETVTYTPLRFALVQSALRDMYELVAARPGGEARIGPLEDQLARLDKLVLNGWDDRDENRLIRWPDECVNVVDGLPRGGLQMAERTLTGEIGSLQATLPPREARIPTSDREHDCVPEIDDAHLPAALAGAITFHLTRE